MKNKPFAQVTVVIFGKRSKFGSMSNALDYLLIWRAPFVRAVRDFNLVMDLLAG